MNLVVLSIIHCQTSEICTQQIYNICFSLAWPTSYLISLGSSKIQTLKCPFKDWKEFRTHLPNCNASACELEDMIWRYARKNLARLNIFIKVSEKFNSNKVSPNQLLVLKISKNATTCRT